MAAYKYIIEIGRESAHSLTTKCNCSTQNYVCYQAGKAFKNNEWFAVSMYMSGIGYKEIASWNFGFEGLEISDTFCPPQLKTRLEHLFDKYGNKEVKDD